MDLILWLGIAAVVVLAVWMAAPHHYRMIDDRYVSFDESQVNKIDKI